MLHLLLGVLLRSSSALSTAHAVLVLAAALLIVLRARRLEWVLAAVGYVVGAETLWRMTDARVFYETGKYALAVLLGISFVRLAGTKRRLALPVAYMAMFLPGVVVGVFALGFAAREPLSFNLSGPIALAVAVLFFTQVRCSLTTLRMVLWSIVLPTASVAALVLVATLGESAISFTGESNFTTSGGFGPNQVSAVLGFGALACLLLALTERALRLRLLEATLGMCFLAQALLTFSRGGVVNVAVASGLALAVMAGRERQSGRLAALLLVMVVIASFVVFPRLDSFTEGQLQLRYEDTSLTNRNVLINDDLDLFEAHPVVGVGVGVSAFRRPSGEVIAPHTEFSRLLAEQGLLGIGALVILLGITFEAFRRARPGLPRALVAAMAGWALTEMTHAGMRIALISLAVGLAVAAAELVDDRTAHVRSRSPLRR